MAIDVLSSLETTSSSPRISFSDDLKQTDSDKTRCSDSFLLNPTIDFDLCLDQAFSQHLSSADEIFSNGKILPFQTKFQTKNQLLITPHKKETNHHHHHPVPEPMKKKRLIEFLSTSVDPQEDEKPISKPFWQFRRSSSINRSLLFLTRSNSTGSVPNPNPKPKQCIQKQHSMKEQSSTRYNANSSVQAYSQAQNWPNCYNCYDTKMSSKKTYLNKSTSRSSSYGNNNNGVKVTPVLNIPPTYIGRGTVNLFGIASFFSGKSSKKKQK